MRRGSAILLVCVIAIALSACARHRAPSRDAPEPSARDGTPAQQPDEPSDPPLVADFPAPTLSPQTRAVWDTFAKDECRRRAKPPPPPPDCMPRGHTTPCSQRAFESELARCDGTFSCLQLAQQIDECERCGTELPDELVRARIKEVSADCAGLLRLADAPRSYETDDLFDLAQSPAAIECLAKSKHPRVRFLLGRWARNPNVAKVLVGDPEPTRKWLRAQLALTRAGRDLLFDSWALWDTFDALGAAADPLLPDVRALAMHPTPGVRRRHHQYDRDAIHRLGARKDRDAIPLLRRILGAHTDWRAQEAAAKSLGDIGVDAIAAAPELDDAARDHWSTYVRDTATWAAARVRGEGPATPPEPKAGEWRHDERCPMGAVSLDGDDFSSGDMWQQRWPWMTTMGEQTITLPDPDRSKPVLPRELPQIDLAARFPDVTGAHTSLAEEATAVWPLHRGWVVGTDFGEFGGSLWWLDRRGRARHLGDANVKAIVQLGDDIYAVEGLAHLGSDRGSLIRIEDTPRGVRVHPALELPNDPEAWWVRGDELWVGTFDGLFIVDTDLHIRAQPCHADETYPGTLDDERIAPAFARVRPIIDRCLEALPADLPCGGTYEHHIALTFRVDASGTVTAAEPLDFFPMRFPEAEACIAAHAIGWRLPAPKGGAAIFAYAFSPTRAEPRRR